MSKNLCVNHSAKNSMIIRKLKEEIRVFINSKIGIGVLLAVIGAVFFIPFIGRVPLFDWDEVNFAECAREMLVLKDYLNVHINFQPFWEKPPLFFWFQALSMKVFGINEFAARFPNAVCGMATLIVLFLIGEKLYNKKFGLVWAGAYAGSILPYVYFKSGIIDPWFNLFIFSSLYFLILFYWEKQRFNTIVLKRASWFYLLISGFIAGLSLMTKGPAAYLIICFTLVVYGVSKRFTKFISPLQFVGFSFAAGFFMLSWYSLQVLVNGPGFIEAFIAYQYRLLSTADAGHGGFPGYHFIVLLLGCFPASLFAVDGFFRKSSSDADYQRDFKRWMIYLLCVVLILFSLIRSKIVHYSSLCYFPLTFLAALDIREILEGRRKVSGVLMAGLGTVAFFYIAVIFLIPYLADHIHLVQSLLKNDPFAVATLDASVTWTGWEVLPGVWLAAIMLLMFYWIKHQKNSQALFTLFSGTALFVMSSLVIFTGKIERYSQESMVQFCKSIEKRDPYVHSEGFKSYVHYFYTSKRPGIPESNDPDWLISGPIDKEVYFISKINCDNRLKQASDIIKIGERNGFVFYKREPVRNPL